MPKLVAEGGQVKSVSTFKASTYSVTFKRAAIATTGDIGEVRLSADGAEVILSYAQAISLANEILKRCQ